MGQERRRFPRYQIRVPVKLRIGEEPSVLKSETGDLSEGGLCFYWPNGLLKETFLTAGFPLANQIYEMEGRVSYSIWEAERKAFRIGVEFHEPSPIFRAKLNEEISKMERFRETLVRERRREVSDEELASEWVKKYAEEFMELYK